MSDSTWANASPVSVVIVNWRAPDLTLDAIESLRMQTHNLHRIYIVDNGIADGSIERFEEVLAGPEGWQRLRLAN